MAAIILEMIMHLKLKRKHILILLTGFLLVFSVFKETGEYGMIPVGRILLTIVYLIVFLAFIIFNLIKTIKKKDKFDFIPVLVTLTVFFLILVSYKGYFKSKTVMTAYANNYLTHADSTYKKTAGYTVIILEFRKNHHCIVNYNLLDCGHINRYRYNINNDTVKFDNSIIKDSDSSLTDKYYFDKKNNILIPITKLRYKLIPLEVKK
ncbi:MAG: hypothetical protein PHD97_13310 [Bacteroidales bacterium]|nr:hypothetical protein [Bacteroidales bacterium]